MKFVCRPRVALLFPTLLCACSLAGAQENRQQPTQTIRVSVDRVNVGVIGTNHGGHFVEGLLRGDFRVFDNGIEQPLTGFAAIEEPAQVLLLIEAGPAVYLLESGHLQAAHALLDGLSAGDRIAMVKYAEAPQAILDFTAEKQAAAASFGQLRSEIDRKSTRLNSSHSQISYAVFCLKKKNPNNNVIATNVTATVDNDD